jgi:hypothetical protein
LKPSSTLIARAEYNRSSWIFGLGKNGGGVGLKLNQEDFPVRLSLFTFTLLSPSFLNVFSAELY